MSHLLPALPAAGQPEAFLFLAAGLGVRGAVSKPGGKHRLQMGDQSVRIQIGPHLQGIQQFPVLSGDPRILPQNTAEMGHLQDLRQPDAHHLYCPPGILLPQVGQGGPVGPLPLKGGVLQGQPGEILIEVLLLGPGKGIQQLLQLLVVKVPVDRPHDAVPVQLRPALLVIDPDRGLEAVVPGGVPDQVGGPAGLILRNIHISQTAGPGSGRRAAGRQSGPPPAGAQTRRSTC